MHYNAASDGFGARSFFQSRVMVKFAVNRRLVITLRYKIGKKSMPIFTMARPGVGAIKTLEISEIIWKIFFLKLRILLHDHNMW